MREDGSEAQGDLRVINSRDKGGDGLEGSDAHINVTVLDGAVKHLHEVVLIGGKFLPVQLEIAQNAKGVHRELAGFGLLGACKGHQLLDKLALLVELRVDLDEHVALTLQKLHVLAIEIEGALDSCLD